MPEDGVETNQFWDGASETWRYIAYIGDDNRPAYGMYDVLVNGSMFQTVLTSGTTSQAAGVATLICAHNKANETYIHPLGLREAVLRGCVNIDVYNSTASGGTNRCCSDGTTYTCTSGDVYTPNDDCDGKLGAGRLDAYRSLTLWGRVARDTTFQGDVYVSGDVLFTNDAVITIKRGTTFHIMPEDITDVATWQPLIQYDMDGVVDNACKMPDQLAGETTKIELIVGEATINFQATEYAPIHFQSYCKVPTSNDWCQMFLSSDAIVTGWPSTAIHVTNTVYGIHQ
jgi:hypothetical protein